MALVSVGTPTGCSRSGRALWRGDLGNLRVSVTAVWVFSIPALLLGIAVLTNFKGIGSRFYDLEARSWTKAGIGSAEYKADHSFNGYRYSRGLAFCALAILIAVLYGVLAG